MSALPTLRSLRPSLASASTDAVLSPVHCLRIAPAAARFSTSPSPWKADNNKLRGVSAVRRTGPRKRQTLSVKDTSDYESQRLPKPTKRATKVEGDPDHGLWDFFKNKQLIRTPLENAKHGREWTVSELRERDWDTLQKLWWVCVKERNRLATEDLTRNRLKYGFGFVESRDRDETVQKTMKAIIDVLVERNVAYQDAYKLAQQDPDIDLSRTDHQYQPPSSYEADEIAEDEALNEGLEDPTGAVPQEVKQQTSHADTTTMEAPATARDDKVQTNKL